MLATVEFDNKPTIDAHEVHDVSVDRGLSSKLPTGKAAVAQAKPQHALRVGLVAPQTPGISGVSSHRSCPLTRPRCARAPSPFRGEGKEAAPGLGKRRVWTMRITRPRAS